MSFGEDPTTQELRLDQLKREKAEREAAEQAAEQGANPDDTDQHEARAAKAGYLRAKLEERADAERRAAEDD